MAVSIEPVEEPPVEVEVEVEVEVNGRVTVDTEVAEWAEEIKFPCSDLGPSALNVISHERFPHLGTGGKIAEATNSITLSNN